MIIFGTLADFGLMIAKSHKLLARFYPNFAGMVLM